MHFKFKICLTALSCRGINHLFKNGGLPEDFGTLHTLEYEKKRGQKIDLDIV